MTSAAGWFHCSVKPISRGAGRSVVAAAAYRSGLSLYDQRTDQTHDYTRRQGVESTFIVASDHAPEWAHDWGKLWNAAEASEKRGNSRTAREIELALPACVNAGEREKIVRVVAGHLVERYGVAVAAALHKPSRDGNQRNYHAHILMTTRRMEEKGLTGKTRELDDRKSGRQEITHIRYFAAAVINDSLASSGSSERVDPRSHKERGLEFLPTQHLGVEAAAMERKKKRSRIGDFNRDIAESNQRIKTLQQERAALNTEIEKEREPEKEREALRARHYAEVRKHLAALQKPKVRKLALRISQNAAYEFIKKRRDEFPKIEPPQNPLEPPPGSSYADRIRKQQQERDNDRGMDI